MQRCKDLTKQIIMQVVFIIMYDAGNKGLEDSVATKVYQAVRVLRLIRFTSLLRRLYATAAAAQSSILPGLHVSSFLAILLILLSNAKELTYLTARYRKTLHYQHGGKSYELQRLMPEGPA